MSDQLTPGTICYDESGQKMKFIAREGEGYIVRPVLIGHTWDGDEGDEYEGSPTVVDRLFREPPVEVYAERIQRLQDEVESWRQKAAAARDEHDDAQAGLKALEKATPYQGLIDVILGTATHAIEVDTWKVHDLKSLRNVRFSFEHRREGRASFNIFMTAWDRREVSGRVVLARSEEEARERLKGFIQEALSGADWKTAIYEYRAEKVREAGVELPQHVLDHLRELRVQKAVVNYEEHLRRIGLEEEGAARSIAAGEAEGVDVRAEVAERAAKRAAKAAEKEAAA